MDYSYIVTHMYVHHLVYVFHRLLPHYYYHYNSGSTNLKVLPGTVDLEHHQAYLYIAATSKSSSDQSTRSRFQDALLVRVHLLIASSVQTLSQHHMVELNNVLYIILTSSSSLPFLCSILYLKNPFFLVIQFLYQ